MLLELTLLMVGITAIVLVLNKLGIITEQEPRTHLFETEDGDRENPFTESSDSSDEGDWKYTF